MIYYLNADFDLKMGGAVSDSFLAQVYQLNLLALAVSKKDDNICSRVLPDEGYYKYLKSRCIENGLVVSPESCQLVTGAVSYVWGLNNDTLPFVPDKDFTDISTVQKINNRRFSLALETKVRSKIQRALLKTQTDLQNFVNDYGFPVVLKPLQSSAGYGFHILNNLNDLASVKYRFPCLCEQWVKRIADFSYGFTVDDPYNSFSIRVLRSNHRGTFESVTAADERHLSLSSINTERLIDCQEEICKQLISNNYKGIVNVDGFIYQTNNEIIVEYLSEINARRTIADVTMLYKKRFHNKFGRIVSINVKAALKNGYQMLELFSKENTILLLSPLNFYFDRSWFRTRRLFFYLGSESYNELDLFEHDLRNLIV